MRCSDCSVDVCSSDLPTYNFGGYVQGIYGRYDRRELEGAVNVPIVDGKVALRVAGQIRRQDPRNPALDDGPGFSDIPEDNARVSLLLEQLGRASCGESGCLYV